MQRLFKQLNKGSFILLYSALTDNELAGAPEKVKDLASDLPERYTE